MILRFESHSINMGIFNFLRNMNIHFSFYSLLEGVNLLVSSGTASAIAGDRLCMVKRKTARKDDTKVSKNN